MENTIEVVQTEMKATMKKLYPYIFPAAALAFVLFLLFRWYTLRMQRESMTSLLHESVTIEELSADDASDLLLGVEDRQTAELTGENPAHMGQVRYELTEDDQLRFSVTAELPHLSAGTYQVWLRQAEGDVQRKALTLGLGKAGYIGSAVIDASTLPLEVLVTKEMTDDTLLEEIVLRGTIEVAE
jgi:hypothetical protein